MTNIKHLTGIRLALAAIGISLATFLIVLDYTIANVSIPYIAGDLGISANEGTYVITAFAVGSAIVLPITGWLTHRIGLVRLSLIALIGFVFFSWTCGISPNSTSLVVSRFLQGLASGPLIPVSQTMIISIFPPEKKNVAIGYWGTVVVVAPVIGPILGGWISYDFYWPWIFFINIPLGLLSALIIHLYLRPYETPTKKLPTDWIGLILLAIGVSTLQFILDKGEQYDWTRSPLILTLMIISFLSFLYLVVWELTHPTPLLELRLLKIPSYHLSCILIITVYAIYFGGVVLVPLWLQQNMGYTSTWAGVAVAPLGIMPVFFSGLISKLIDKVGQIIPLACSLILFAASSFDGAFFNTDVSLFHIAFSASYSDLASYFSSSPSSASLRAISHLKNFPPLPECSTSSAPWWGALVPLFSPLCGPAAAPTSMPTSSLKSFPAEASSLTTTPNSKASVSAAPKRKSSSMPRPIPRLRF